MNNATPEQIFQTAIKFHQEGKLQQAEQLYEALTQVRPSHAPTWFFYGMSRYALGDRSKALNYLAKAIELDRNNPDYHNNIGEIFRQLGMLEEAEAHFKLSIALKPGNSDALSNLALVYKAKGEMNYAKLFFAEALDANPKNLNAMLNVGGMYQAEGEYKDALECYIAAMGISPDHPHALRGAAFCLSEQMEYSTAAGMLSKLTAGKPDMFREKVDLAMLTLRNKDFRKGFQLLEARLKDRPEIMEGPEKTLWRGTSLKGKTLYVYYEKAGLSGFGDTLMFMRLLLELKKYEPEKVVFKVQPELLTLVQENMPEYVEVTTDTCTEFDTHSPLISLALVLNLRAKSMPLADGYVRADGSKYAGLMDKDKKNIGIVFNTSKEHFQHEKRSVPQSAFDAPASDASVKLFYISNQEPDAPLSPTITDMRPSIKDFKDTAEIISALDMVITPDTATAHLAGAMGKKTALLIDEQHDWRWFNAKNSQDTVWYSSVTTYIREKKNSWEDTMKIVRI